MPMPMPEYNNSLAFVAKYQNTRFYQPIIFTPGVIEIEGLWHNATKELADNILNDIKGKTLLDLGCNVGYFVFEALRRGAKKVVGVDYDKHIIHQAKEIQDILQLPAEFIHDDISSYKCESFDIILMLNVLEFVNNAQTCLRKFTKQFSYKMFIERPEHLKFDFGVGECNVESDYSQRAGGRVLNVLTLPKDI